MILAIRTWKNKRGFWQDAMYRYFKNKLAVLGLIISLIIIIITLFAPWIAPYTYEEQDYTKIGTPPSLENLMGTDELGRDILSRVIYGGRPSISLGIIVQLTAVLIGMPLGALAGYYGGKLDYIVTRMIDLFYAFPSLLMVILLMVVFGPGYFNVLYAIIIVSWPIIARLVRGQFLQLREAEFVLAARAIGAKDSRIIFKHILPNVMGTVIVAVTLGIPVVMFREAGLSFMGIGIVPPIPSWGKMVGESYMHIQMHWHIVSFPALALGVTILAFTFVGNGLQDALSPRETTD